jgi:hypothetical protein
VTEQERILKRAIIGVLGDSHYFGEDEPEYKVGDAARATLQAALNQVASPTQPVQPIVQPKPGHFREVCSCGAVIRQCRCPGPHEIRVIERGCPKCK